MTYLRRVLLKCKHLGEYVSKVKYQLNNSKLKRTTLIHKITRIASKESVYKELHYFYFHSNTVGFTGRLNWKKVHCLDSLQDLTKPIWSSIRFSFPYCRTTRIWRNPTGVHLQMNFVLTNQIVGSIFMLHVV